MSIKHILFISAFCLLMMRCEYEVAQPVWYDDFTEPATPTISVVEPSAATAGCNYITITGENFSGSPDVYFDNVAADVLSFSKTSLTVRRPNLVSDSSIVKVVCDSAIVVAKYSPYQITKVLDSYGNFLEDIVLKALAVDDQENLYIIDADKTIYKVTPGGEKSVLTLDAALSKTPTDACYRDGALYILENNRPIEKVDLSTGVKTRYAQLPAGKKGDFGAFDSLGYYYAGGAGTGLLIVTPDLTSNKTDYYLADTISAIQVCGDYLYLGVKLQNDASSAIIRHPLSSGSVGDPDTLIQLRNTEFASRKVTGLAFSADGKMYLATDAVNPFLVYDFDSGQLDYFYKEILPSYCKKIYWGGANYLYMITGDDAADEDWTVYRVDMGFARKT